MRRLLLNSLKGKGKTMAYDILNTFSDKVGAFFKNLVVEEAVDDEDSEEVTRLHISGNARHPEKGYFISMYDKYGKEYYKKLSEEQMRDFAKAVLNVLGDVRYDFYDD